MPAPHFESAVMGRGKGGKTLVAKMAAAARPGVMIEKGMIGGSCMDVRCIPAKSMVELAKVTELARRAADLNFRVKFDRAEQVAIRDQKRAMFAEIICATSDLQRRLQYALTAV